MRIIPGISLVAVNVPRRPASIDTSPLDDKNVEEFMMWYTAGYWGGVEWSDELKYLR